MAAILRLARRRDGDQSFAKAQGLEIVASTNVETLRASDVANALWACGKLQLKVAAFSDAVRRRALETLPEFAATDLAKTAWAFARLRDFSQPFFEALGNASCRVSAEATAQELSGLA